MARTFTFRLTSQGVTELKRDLEALGPAGQQAFQKLQSSSPQLASSLDIAARKTDQLRAQMEAVGRTSATTAAGNGRLINTFQQAGFQIQDFATQVAGGTSALRAFGQQAPQFLGVFGPAGAIAGAVISVGALVAQMLFLNSGARDAAAGTDVLSDAIERSNALLMQADDLAKLKAENDRREAIQSVQKAQALSIERLALLQLSEARQRDYLVTRAAAAQQFGGSAGGFDLSALDPVLAQIEAANAEIADLADRLGKLNGLDPTSSLPGLAKQSREAAAATAVLTESQRALNEAIEAEVRIRQDAATLPPGREAEMRTMILEALS